MVTQLESEETDHLSVDIRDRIEIKLCQEGCEVPEPDVGQDDGGGLLPGVLPQDRLQHGAEGGQHHLVTGQGAILTPEDDITLAHVMLPEIVDLECHKIAH